MSKVFDKIDELLNEANKRFVNRSQTVVKKPPRPESHENSSEDSTYHYKEPYVHPDFKMDRSEALQDPVDAYKYAIANEEPANDETREACCKRSDMAYYYAKNVDEGYHTDTYHAVMDSDFLFNKYIKEFGHGDEPEPTKPLKAKHPLSDPVAAYRYAMDMESDNVPHRVLRAVAKRPDLAYWLTVKKLKKTVPVLREAIHRSPILWGAYRHLTSP